jgi:hypothetical protein
MIPAETEAEILRLYHAEKWKVGTIAAQLRWRRWIPNRWLSVLFRRPTLEECLRRQAVR